MHQDARIAPALTVVLLSGWTALCWGIGPPRGDFANYWVSAALWLEGADLAHLYEYAWFQEQADRWFAGRMVGFAVLTPPSALVLVPLVPLGPAVAAWVYLGAQWAMGISLAAAVARLAERPLWVGLLGLLAFTPALHAHLLQGQLHLPVVLLVALGLLAFQRGQDVLAGACWALAVGLKVHAWPLLVVAAIASRWRVLATAGATLLAGLLTSVACLGWPLHAVFFSEIAPAASAGWFLDPWTPALQSSGQLSRRLFVPHPGLNPDGPWAVPWLSSALVALVFAGVCGLTLARAFAWPRLDAARRRQLLGAASIAAMAGGTIFSRYHLILLLPGLALAGAALWERRQRGRAVAIVLLALAVCWLPIPTHWPGGWLDLLAVPRCWLSLALWALMMPWGRVSWRVAGLAALAVSAFVAAAVARTPVLPDAQRVDGPEMPLVTSHLHATEAGLVFRGLTRSGWKWLRRSEDGVVTPIDDPGLGPSSEVVDGDRRYFLSDAGVGVKADRIWVE